ncbi:MAG: hypothetical protein H8E20_09185 [Verrucomicrobia bacterium]|nr:hypothetical protein [Verrucomicrobiota bacterium]
MKLLNWHKPIRAVLAGLLILGASTGVEARKGYLPRIFKRNKAAAVEPVAEAPNGPMGRVVIPLNRLTAGDVERMLDDAYGRDNSFSVVEPSRLAKGVIVIGPKSEIDGIRELLAQADPDDRNYLIANKTILPEGIVSEAELEAELPDSFYAEARKNAEKHAGEEPSSWRQKANPMNWFSSKEPVTRKGNWRQRANPLNWFRGDKPRNKPSAPPRKARGERLKPSKKRGDTERELPIVTNGHTAIKLAHADAGEISTQMQALYGGTEVRIVPVKQANIILVTGSKSETRDIHRSIVELDQAAVELSAGEIADATQYIRKMADSRNTAFRITRPHKPRIRPLPPISITGDPEPEFNQAVAAGTVRLPDYVKPPAEEHTPVAPKEPDPLQKFFEDYMRNSMDAKRRSSQADALHEYYMSTGQLPRPVVEVHVDRGPQSVTNLLQYLYTKPATPPAKPSGSSATYQQGDRKPVSTKPHH